MSNSLVAVATFNFTTDPNFLLLKTALDHHDIPYYAANENTVNVNPFWSISVGGIQVMVNEADLPEAVVIWREISEADENMDVTNEEDFGESDQILDDIRHYNILKTAAVDSQKSNRTYHVIVILLFSFIALFIALMLYSAME